MLKSCEQLIMLEHLISFYYHDFHCCIVTINQFHYCIYITSYAKTPSVVSFIYPVICLFMQEIIYWIVAMRSKRSITTRCIRWSSVEAVPVMVMPLDVCHQMMSTPATSAWSVRYNN